MRKMILADDEEGRKKALAALAPYQKQDFIGIFEAMDGLPVTIRLLDPPLHEFLPHDEAGQAEVARQLGIPVEKVKRRVEQLHEANPMLGLRGCRLPIKFPEIGDMQIRAILEAAIEVKKRGKSVLPEIMIPLIGTVEELTVLKKRALAQAEEVFKQAGQRVDFLIGTMIEIPRGRAHRRPDCGRSRVLLVRYQRPDPDDLRLLPRRHRLIHARLRRSEDPSRQPVSNDRRQGSGPAY